MCVCVYVTYVRSITMVITVPIVSRYWYANIVIYSGMNIHKTNNKNKRKVNIMCYYFFVVPSFFFSLSLI